MDRLFPTSEPPIGEGEPDGPIVASDMELAAVRFERLALSTKDPQLREKCRRVLVRFMSKSLELDRSYKHFPDYKLAAMLAEWLTVTDYLAAAEHIGWLPAIGKATRAAQRERMRADLLAAAPNGMMASASKVKAFDRYAQSTIASLIASDGSMSYQRLP